jgi:hypothetical protein
MKESERANSTENSVLQRMFEPLPDVEIEGSYDPSLQTWSHRNPAQFSPVKNNQEM